MTTPTGSIPASTSSFPYCFDINLEKFAAVASVVASFAVSIFALISSLYLLAAASAAGALSILYYINRENPPAVALPAQPSAAPTERVATPPPASPTVSSAPPPLASAPSFTLSSATSSTASAPSASLAFSSIREKRHQEFQNMPLSIEMPPQLFLSALANPGRNRYENVLPLETTRFLIAEEPGFYFNASRVLGGKGIAAQGPLAHEHAEFWKMVWHSDSSVIVMLTNLVEKGSEKCSKYWPENDPLEFENGKFTVSCVKKLSVYPATEKRIFQLKKGGIQKTVTHYHLTQWPDFGVINSGKLAEFMEEIDRKRTDSPSSPIIAHCSAGLGRTGTFFAILEGHERFQEGIIAPNLVPDLVRQLRHERPNMVQTADQYCLIYDTLEVLGKGIASPAQE